MTSQCARVRRALLLGHTSPSPSKKPRFFTPSRYCESTLKKLDNLRSSVSDCDVYSLIDEDAIFLYLTCRFGLPGANIFLGALCHVPVGFPNRLTYISNILQASSVDVPVKISELSAHVERYCEVSTFCGCIPKEVLWKSSYASGKSHIKFLLPDVNVCLLPGCGGSLFGSEKDTTCVTLYTLQGPIPALKSILTCRVCKTRYNLDKYHLENGNSFLYSHKSPVFCASNKAYFTVDAFEMLCESGNHAFVSAQAFTEIYNSTFHACHPTVEAFQKWKDFLKQSQPDLEREEPTCSVVLSRKLTTEVFFNGELHNELRERQLTNEVSFRSDSSRDAAMKMIDNLRRNELYPHLPEDCSPACVDRGCKNLRVIDACWKLCIPHCMMAVSTKVDGYPLLNFPNVCVDEPKPGSVFCEAHHTLLERHRIPTEKKAFLKHIGCKPTPKSQTDIKHVDQKVLSFMDTLTKTDPSSTLVGTSATSFQGTQHLLDEIPVDVLNSNDPSTYCNKDTGEKSRLRQRARGHFAAVTGGGNILCFNPIYKSESPSQVFILVIQMLYMEFKDTPDEELEAKMEDYILAYDNICHLDALKAAKEDVSLPGALSKIWVTIKKIIDRLHLKNHKNKTCQTVYNPDVVLKDYPKYNTMAAEQMFSWFSRFKKIVNSMTQTNHLFYLHRMCKRRNRYTADCRKHAKEPVLPGINPNLATHSV